MNTMGACFWDHWLQEAQRGNPYSAWLVLSQLASAVADSSLTDRQREFLAKALQAIADAPEGKPRFKAAKIHLLLSRGRGRVVADHENYERAHAVWCHAGDVSGSSLDDACHAVLLARGNPDPDIRGTKKAYLAWAPTFIAIREIEHERDVGAS